MQFDFNIVGLLAAMLGGFGLFVRLTIKSAISDLKDDLAKTYMATTDLQARFQSIYHRLETLEMYMGQQGHNAR